MPNTNGLSSLAPVYLTGDPTSNIWEVKGGSGPTPPSGNLVSPVVIQSTDGTKTASITVGNAPGDMALQVPTGDLFLAPTGAVNIVSGGNITLTPQNGSNIIINSDTFNHSATVQVDDTLGDLTMSVPGGDMILAPNSGIVTINPATGAFVAGTDLTVDSSGNFSIVGINDITITPFNGELQLGKGSIRVMEASGGQYTEIATANDGATSIGSQGDITFLTYGTNNIQIQKSGGAIGIVYDTVYNPLPSFPVITALGSSDGGIGNLTFSQAVTVVAGATYQLQLSMEDVTPVSGSYLSLSATDTGVGVIDYSGITLLASAVLTGTGAQLTSNYFTAPDTSFTVTVAGFNPTPPPGASVNWTANWKLQLVRVK